MVTYHVGPFEIGANSLWLFAHGMFMLAVVVGLAFLWGALAFARQADARLVRGLRTAGTLTLLGLLALTVTGLVPDVLFEKGALFSGTFHNAFGVVQASVTDENLGAFTGPLLFDIMEHVTLVVPGLAALLCLCLWHFGPRVVEDAVVRRSVLALVSVTGLWVLVVGGVGVYITKILTIPYVR